jgi:hypothetical protein
MTPDANQFNYFHIPINQPTIHPHQRASSLEDRAEFAEQEQQEAQKALAQVVFACYEML